MRCLCLVLLRSVSSSAAQKQTPRTSASHCLLQPPPPRSVTGHILESESVLVEQHFLLALPGSMDCPRLLASHLSQTGPPVHLWLPSVQPLTRPLRHCRMQVVHWTCPEAWASKARGKLRSFHACSVTRPPKSVSKVCRNPASSPRCIVSPVSAEQS